MNEHARMCVIWLGGRTAAGVDCLLLMYAHCIILAISRQELRHFEIIGVHVCVNMLSGMLDAIYMCTLVFLQCHIIARPHNN